MKNIKKVIVALSSILIVIFLALLAFYFMTTGQIKITVSENDAALTIDSKQYQPGKYIRLKSGRHSVTVSKEGFYEQVIDIDILAREKNDQTVTLIKESQIVIVDTDNVSDPYWINDTEVIAMSGNSVIKINSKGDISKVLTKNGLLSLWANSEYIATSTGYIAQGANSEIYDLAKPDKPVLTIQDSFAPVVNYDSSLLFFLRRKGSTSELYRCELPKCSDQTKIAETGEIIGKVIPSPTKNEALLYAGDLFFGGDSSIEGLSMLYYVASDGAPIMIGKEGEAVASPRFSPDGNKIGFLNEDGLVLYDIVKNSRSALTGTGTIPVIGSFNWVNGEDLAVAFAGQSLNYSDIYRFNLNTPNARTKIANISLSGSNNRTARVSDILLSPNSKITLISTAIRQYFLFLSN